MNLAAATQVVETLIAAGVDIANQRELAIDALVQGMRPSPPDVAGPYFENRGRVIGDLDELDNQPHDTEPPTP